MIWLYFVIAVLATYRLSHMIAREDGPFDVFMLLRELVGQENWIGRGLHCVLCISFWVSLPAAVLVGLPWFVGWFGVAGGVLFVHQLFERI